jgi:hypothetical protein
MQINSAVSSSSSIPSLSSSLSSPSSTLPVLCSSALSSSSSSSSSPSSPPSPSSPSSVRRTVKFENREYHLDDVSILDKPNLPLDDTLLNFMLDYITSTHSKPKGISLPAELFTIMNITSELNDDDMKECIKLITKKVSISELFNYTNIIIPVHTYSGKTQHWMTLIAVNCLHENGFIVSYDSIKNDLSFCDKAVDQLKKLLLKVHTRHSLSIHIYSYSYYTYIYIYTHIYIYIYIYMYVYICVYIMYTNRFWYAYMFVDCSNDFQT